MIDFEALIKKYGDDRALVLELVDIVMSEFQPSYDALVTAVKSGDAKNIQFYAHKLKGSVGTLDAHGLRDLLQKIENHADVETNIDLLSKAYPEFISKIKEFKGS